MLFYYLLLLNLICGDNIEIFTPKNSIKSDFFSELNMSLNIYDDDINSIKIVSKNENIIFNTNMDTNKYDYDIDPYLPTLPYKITNKKVCYLLEFQENKHINSKDIIYYNKDSPNSLLNSIILLNSLDCKIIAYSEDYMIGYVNNICKENKLDCAFEWFSSNLYNTNYSFEKPLLDKNQVYNDIFRKLY